MSKKPGNGPPEIPVRGAKSRRSVAQGESSANLESLNSNTGADGTGQKEPSRPQSARVADYLTREVIRPEDQLQLTEEELKKEHTRILRAKNRNAPSNITRYSYKEKLYKAEPTLEQLQLHFTLDGWSMHKESEDAKKQEAFLDQIRATQQRLQQQAMMNDTDIQTEEDAAAMAKARSVKNKFSFNERATQTYSQPPKHRTTATDPPPREHFVGNVTQWEIYDAYMEFEENKRIQREKSKVAARQASKDEDGEKKESKELMQLIPDKAPEPQGQKSRLLSGDEMLSTEEFHKSLIIMERMVNQNYYREIMHDFKYWDDPSDQYREEGNLLPLWKFKFDKAKRKAVTAIVWSPEFFDFFAVGYGSYDYLRPSSGLIACFSLKNPSYPEFYFKVDSGVMAIDFHPQYSSLIAVGLYDGRVMVFDIQSKSTEPIFQSSANAGKHTDPVWQVKWEPEGFARDLKFMSISSDGRVTLWTLVKNELHHTDIMELKYQPSSTKEVSEGDEGGALFGLAGGCSFDFNKFNEHLFLVGTEEGQIHKCSKTYNSHYLETYEGHDMAVYNLRWNPFHSRVFLSCSADWTVKIWEHNHNSPLMMFDLGNSVGSIAWAPFSSTTFAAVTTDGKVHIFDLSRNKNDSICEQQIVKKAKLTHIAFNHKEPIIIVGDDHGVISCLKLSPNLRKHGTKEEEMAKMEKIVTTSLKGEGHI